MKINYREKWEQAEVKLMEAAAKIQELKTKIQAVRNILKDEERSRVIPDEDGGL
jgi:hypothetical protein